MTNNHQNCIGVINEQEDIALPALMKVDKALECLEGIARGKREAMPCRALAFQTLAFLYGVKRDFRSAERAFDGWERTADSPEIAIAERAFFYFATENSSERAIREAQRLTRFSRGNLTSSRVRAIFRAFNIQGRSQLALGRTKAAAATFAEMLFFVRKHRDSIIFELDFAEELVQAGLALKECQEYLQFAKFPLEGDWQARSRKLLRKIKSSEER
jgi:hypothetical protein